MSSLAMRWKAIAYGINTWCRYLIAAYCPLMLLKYWKFCGCCHSCMHTVVVGNLMTSLVSITIVIGCNCHLCHSATEECMYSCNCWQFSSSRPDSVFSRGLTIHRQYVNSVQAYVRRVNPLNRSYLLVLQLFVGLTLSCKVRLSGFWRFVLGDIFSACSKLL
jgi:hypothetical protein